MALNTFKCNYLTPLHFKTLIIVLLVLVFIEISVLLQLRFVHYEGSVVQ